MFCSRIYPKAMRVNSSNYDPIVAWALGNQLVALNYQTPCQQMHMYHSRFRQNGQWGYVLKPAYMLSDEAQPTPSQLLTLHIISGQQLPKPKGASKGDVRPL